jgi:hypothetical protein
MNVMTHYFYHRSHFKESNIDCEEAGGTAGNLCKTERHVRHQVTEYVLCKYTHILAWATQDA